MNDPGLQDVIQDSEAAVEQKLDAEVERKDSDAKSPHSLPEYHQQTNKPDVVQEPHKQHRHSRHRYEEGSREGHKPAQQEASVYQPTYWWFTSTAFPLFAGTFGPIANLLSVCALVESWRVRTDDGSRIQDPHWLTGLNAMSLFFALVANLVLMFNFARRIRYALAQPITITLWYISSILLVICICLVNTLEPHPDPIPQSAHSQSYYYGIISCVLYFSAATLLLISSLGSVVFHAYPPSFATLTGPQRTLILQTTSFSLYLALGAGVFAAIEGWAFTDGIYWADYTLLTIGLGSDFPLETVLGRMLLIPYAAVGITLIGLVISSVRGLVLERAKAKVARRHLQKERKKWSELIKKRRQAAFPMAETTTQDFDIPLASPWRKWKERQLTRLPRQLDKHADVPLKHEDLKGAWHRAEFELMRLIQNHSESRESYEALWISFFIILIVWIGGTLIFWSCEHKAQGWTFPDAFFFSYTTLLTIGYGDFFPSTSAGKPFFVVWSLISVPAMTVFISNMGDTAVKWLQEITVWISKWTILPERDPEIDENHSKQAELTTQEKSNRMSEENINAHDRRNVRNQTQASPRSNTHSSSSRRRQTKSGHHQQPDHSSEPRASGVLEHDVEHFGNQIDDFEKSEGREGSLAGRLAREISHLSKDLHHKPPKKYTWDQWAVWLKMLGERDDDNSPPPSPHRKTLRSTEGDSRRPSAYNEESHTQSESDVHSTAQTEEVDWRWTWLSDEGPLFSQLTETEWILEKLCFRLEEVLEDEIREAHAVANERNQTSSVQ